MRLRGKASILFVRRCFLFLLVIVIVLFSFLGGRRNVAIETTTPHWWMCVRNMGRYADPQNTTEFRWKENPCGFRFLTTKDIQRRVLFTSRKKQVFFLGDSTAYRNFVFAVNTFLPFSKIDGYSRIAFVRDRIDYSALVQEKDLYSTSLTNNTRVDEAAFTEYPTLRNGSLTYIKVRYISLSLSLVTSAIEEINDGIIVLYFGTWDLNWQINARERVPHLGGPRRHLPTAIRYWTKFVHKLMESIQCALLRKPPHERPLIMFLEQMTLNCNSGRFSGGRNAFKKCGSVAVPVVIPLYRRVLTAVAFHLNIPVVPTSHFFKDDYAFCQMSDGVHLDPACMPTVQQHLWNVYLLLRDRRVVQGLLPGLQAIPDAQQFVDEEFYRNWLKQIDGDAENGLLKTTNNLVYLAGEENFLSESRFFEFTAAVLCMIFVVYMVYYVLLLRSKGRSLRS